MTNGGTVVLVHSEIVLSFFFGLISGFRATSVIQQQDYSADCDSSTD